MQADEQIMGVRHVPDRVRTKLVQPRSALGRFMPIPNHIPKRKPNRPNTLLTVDGRTRYVRRLKVIERALRAEVTRQGRVVDLVMDHRIGAAAEAAVMCEIVRARRSVGVFVDEETATRWLNALDRMMTKVGIKPTFLAPAKPKPAPSLSALARHQAGSV
jgi:hypothetical protein